MIMYQKFTRQLWFIYCEEFGDHVVALVVNYGISNTIVLEIP